MGWGEEERKSGSSTCSSTSASVSSSSPSSAMTSSSSSSSSWPSAELSSRCTSGLRLRIICAERLLVARPRAESRIVIVGTDSLSLVVEAVVELEFEGAEANDDEVDSEVEEEEVEEEEEEERRCVLAEERSASA